MFLLLQSGTETEAAQSLEKWTCDQKVTKNLQHVFFLFFYSIQTYLIVFLRRKGQVAPM